MSYLSRSQCLAEKGDFAGAEAAILSSGHTPEKDPRAVLALARVREKANDPHGALAILDAGAATHSACGPIHLAIAQNAIDAQEPDRALAALGRALQIQPGNGLAHSYCALALLQANRLAEAQDTFRTHGFAANSMFQVRLSEIMETAWLRSGAFFRPPEYSDDGGDARMSLRRIIKMLVARRYREAMPHLIAKAGSDRSDPDTLFAGVYAAEMLCDYQRAWKFLEPIPDEKSALGDPVRATRARVLVRLHRFREAAPLIQSVTIAGPEDYGLNYCLGIMCLAHNRKAEARRYFLTAYTRYMYDTLQTNWWIIRAVLLGYDIR